MAIRTTDISEKNIFDITARYASTIDVFVTLKIDGKNLTFHEIVNNMYPDSIVNISDIATRKKKIAMNESLLELYYINFIYKKTIFTKSFARNLWTMMLYCYQVEIDSYNNRNNYNISKSGNIFYKSMPSTIIVTKKRKTGYNKTRVI